MNSAMQMLALVLTIVGPGHLHKTVRVYVWDLSLPELRCVVEAERIVSYAKRRLPRSRVTGRYTCLDQATYGV